jgi:hypothetical protein
LITRLESCTKAAGQGAPSHALAPTQDSASRRTRSQVAWDVTLGLCAIAYLALVLFDDVESPLLSLALIVLVAYELIQPHVRSQ